jgi:protein O-GlcNAc transferase
VGNESRREASLAKAGVSLPEALARAAHAYAQGRLEEAERVSVGILEAVPKQPDALHLLGVIRGRQGRLAEALQLLEQATSGGRAPAQNWSNRGYVLYLQGRHEEAIASCERALALDPKAVDAINHRANAQLALGRVGEALAGYEQALSIQADFAPAHNNRGLALHRLDRSEEALASFDRALAIEPSYAAALNNRAATLHSLRRYPAALASSEAALAINPDDPDARNNHGLTLFELGRWEEALASFDRVLMVRPRSTEALKGRGAVLYALQRYEEALAAYEGVLATTPNDPQAFAGAVDCALTICDWQRTERFAAELPDRIARAAPMTAPFRLLALTGDPGLQRRGAELYVARTVRVSTPVRSTRLPHPRGRIRVGYLSAQFMAHAGASLIAELLERHDRSRFETIGFALCPDDASELRRRLRASMDAFLDLDAANDREAADQIRACEIDILVDLTGHSRGARLDILAYRPAPIQASWLGHAGTMGADFIDYVIADPIVAPFTARSCFVENIVQLPDSYLVTDTTRPLTSPIATRSAVGLPDTGFVFCCFNNNYKITAPVFERWMRILRAVDASVLWLLRDNPAAEGNLRREAQVRGVDPARLIFAPRVSARDHLARHGHADLFLDTLPFNAHVTAADALWTGLPIVTCLGSAFAGRVAASLLHAAELHELITTDLDQYEQLAVRLAHEPNVLVELRSKLNSNRGRCALFNTGRFARNLEAAYQAMWERAQRGEPPSSFAVERTS